MSPVLTSQPLTDEQFDRLETFLEVHGPADVNLEWVDGYFAALICGPDLVLPSEYLSHVLGEEFDFDSDGQAADIIELLMLHWNTIAGELLRTLGEPEVYMPVLLEDDAGIARGNDWAKGFMRGVRMRPESWRELLYSEKHGGSVLPMMMLAHEDDPDPAMRPPPIGDEKREEILLEMIAGLTRIYRHFEQQRRSPGHTSANVPARREGRKIGRNEPCPCGSGRKYKQCCADAQH
jgi:uncharacterized protein